MSRPTLDPTLESMLAAPAQRALTGAGILKLADLSKLTEVEFKQLHGVGPNAIAKLKNAMKAAGLSFADASTSDAATDHKSIDEYLKALPKDQRTALERLRTAIQSAAPETSEGYSYGMPAFRFNGRPLVAFAAFKDHCSFFPMSPSVIERHAKELKGFETAKGTIRFLPGKPLPATLIKKLVKARMAELEPASRKTVRPSETRRRKV